MYCTFLSKKKNKASPSRLSLKQGLRHLVITYLPCYHLTGTISDKSGVTSYRIVILPQCNTLSIVYVAILKVSTIYKLRSGRQSVQAEQCCQEEAAPSSCKPRLGLCGLIR